MLCHPLFSWQPRCAWHIECQIKERLRTWASFGLTFWHGLFGCFLLIFARFVYNFYTVSFTKDNKKDTKRMSFPKRQVFLCCIWTSFNSKRKKSLFLVKPTQGFTMIKKTTWSVILQFRILLDSITFNYWRLILGEKFEMDIQSWYSRWFFFPLVENNLLFTSDPLLFPFSSEATETALLSQLSKHRGPVSFTILRVLTYTL